MTISTSDYAYLSDEAYNSWTVGQIKQSAPSRDEYEALEVINDALSGYYGVIFQNLRTLEIVVAHRGTLEPATDVFLARKGVRFIFSCSLHVSAAPRHAEAKLKGTEAVNSAHPPPLFRRRAAVMPYAS